ncbi:hypothetical protein FRB96_002831 [Tulasnella sp. 330]|nr:hypothetical protein FRB96_002831 [Tulasnella sp. 330]KAG8875569.1 hypothetical protein FRB97_005011 [Tulasnella sp. 331]
MRMVEGVHDLAEAEQQTMFTNSGLGIGITMPSGAMPVDTGVPVIVTPSMDRINFRDTQVSRIDTLVTSSARYSQWVKEGFGKLNVAGEIPTIGERLEPPSDIEPENYTVDTELYIIGSHLMSMCKITLPVKNTPHPDFAEAIQEALGETDEKERGAALTRVLDQYGHFYLTSVEMGGMKYISSTKKTDSTTSVSTLKAAMSIVAAKQFDVSRERGPDHGQSEWVVLCQEFKKGSQTTVGGKKGIDNPAEWRKSLEPPNAWVAINRLSVASVYTLFDAATKSRMKAALPKLEANPRAAPSVAPTPQAPVTPAAQAPIAPRPKTPVVQGVKVKVQPLYRLFNSSCCDHLYTANSNEKDKTQTHSDWSFECVAAQVPVDYVADSTPLYRLYGHRDHLYTTSKDEADTSSKSNGYKEEGVACYVYTSQKEGTVPLFRMYNAGSCDHLYTVDEDEVARSQRWYRFEGIQCYVYPSWYNP